MKNLTLICEAQVKLGVDADESVNPSGMIEADVTSWGAREGADGRKFNYQPEGFAQWADEFSKGDKPLPMFLNHNDMGMPVGEWNNFEFTDEGMNATGKIYMNTVAGSDLYSVLKESPKMFGGVSVGAYADEAKMVDADGNDLEPDDDGDEGFFQITKGGLREVSVVMYPNNPQAEIQKLECFDADGKPNPRIIEKILRDAGVSKKDATTASGLFKKMILERDVLKPTIEQTPQQGDPDAVVTEAQVLEALEARELIAILNKRI